jgi:hypothetical protein
VTRDYLLKLPPERGAVGIFEVEARITVEHVSFCERCQ